MKYKTGDLLYNKRTKQVRMVEGTGIGHSSMMTPGYVVAVFWGGGELWQDNEVQLIMRAKELRKLLRIRKLYCNDNYKLRKLIPTLEDIYRTRKKK